MLVLVINLLTMILSCISIFQAELITEDLTFDKDLVMNIRYKRNPSPTVVAEEGNRAQGMLIACHKDYLNTIMTQNVLLFTTNNVPLCSSCDLDSS